MRRRNKQPQFRRKGARNTQRFSNFTSTPSSSGRIKYSGNFLTQITTIAGANLVPLTPTNFGAYLTTLSSAFLQYRFTRLVLRCHPSPSTQSYAVAYSSGVDLTNGSNIAMIMQEPCSAFVASTQTVPQTLVINRQILLGESSLKWYKVTAGTPYTTVQTTQGVINVVSAATGSSVQIEIEYTIQLDSADPDLLGQNEQKIWSMETLKTILEDETENSKPPEKTMESEKPPLEVPGDLKTLLDQWRSKNHPQKP